MSEAKHTNRVTRIYLIGMMGSGKSTIARGLAKHLDWTWIDTDACIERNSRLSIAEIFEQRGEEDFRRLEWECVQQAMVVPNAVVSLGGGAPCFYDAISSLLSSGTVVYLKANVDALLSRVATDDQMRPLLLQSDVGVEEKIRSLLEQRREVYERAHVTIETDGKTEEQVEEELVNRLSQP
jgi:shikimate kinase